MENPGKVPMVLIEVQTGTYLSYDSYVILLLNEVKDV